MSREPTSRELALSGLLTMAVLLAIAFGALVLLTFCTAPGDVVTIGGGS